MAGALCALAPRGARRDRQWYLPGRVFALLDFFYPVPAGKNLRPVPFMPYLSAAPSAWVLPLKFDGGGYRAGGKAMFDSEGNPLGRRQFHRRLAGAGQPLAGPCDEIRAERPRAIADHHGLRRGRHGACMDTRSTFTRRDRPDVALGDELASSALNLAKANPRLRPLHLVVRETEFCGLRLAGYFRRRMRENSRNSVRRPRCASLTRRRRADSTLDVILLRRRIAKESHQPIAELLEHMPAKSGHRPEAWSR